MTATNHVATGCLLGAAIVNPIIVLPVALGLHFVLDALPHYGDTNDQPKMFRLLKRILVIDSTVAVSILLAILWLHPNHWPIIVAGGIACASVDLLQIPRYIRYLRTDNVQPLDDWLSQFHHKIQRYERPWGIWVEAVWLALCLGGLWKFVF